MAKNKAEKSGKKKKYINTLDLLGLSDSHHVYDVLFTKVNGLSVPGRFVLVLHQEMQLIYHTDIQENKNRSCCG